VRGNTGPVIVAHRGSSGAAPENTIAAFRHAVRDRADMIELDVRLSSDAALVVMHDRTLRRTAGSRGAVRSRSLAALKMCDAGSWFSPAFSGETIPTLQEVFDVLPPAMLLNIEAKTDGDRRRSALLASTLATCIARNHAAHRVIVTSFDHRFLRQLHGSAPGLVIGALVFPVAGTRRRPDTYRRRLGARWLVYAKRQVSRRTVDRAHRSGLRVGCYTVNTERDYRRVVRSGVDAIVTNVPAAMLALRKR
jgi:glycerophosphoryl diester phosphodiesterase